jgi:CRISPR-associated protein (TIGR03986 family)
MTHTITRSRLRFNRRTSKEDVFVEFGPPLARPRDVTSLWREKFQVTDAALGLETGNRFDEPARGENPGKKIVRFGADVPAVGGQPLDVNRNPYNFVALGNGPWVETANAGHDRWHADLLSGEIRFTGETVTPLFVPAGFPFDASKNDAQLAGAPRHSCRMADETGTEHYAIPGSSLKGAVRSAVEALANDRFGIVNDDWYKMPIPYRRRVFQCGLVTGKRGDDYAVQQVKIAYAHEDNWGTAPKKGDHYYTEDRDWKLFAMPSSTGRYEVADVKAPFIGNLLAGETTNHKYRGIIIHERLGDVTLPAACVKMYSENVKHEHYKRHKDDEERARTYQNLNALEYDKNPETGDLIYFTAAGGRITSFGRNVNYLWPATRSVKDLARDFFPLAKLGIEQPTGLAERMFGFATPHDRKCQSAPFRGKVRVETMWGPAAASFDDEKNGNAPQVVSLKLAPLTAPASRAKSRPLYLAPRQDGTSASYSDPTKPQLRGRKFYWHQESNDPSGIWPKHLYDDRHQPVAGQCPPPLLALKPGTRFEGRIRFDNLSKEELGALLYALAGDDSYKHALKIGKAKPRGLGSLKITITGVMTETAPEYYKSLMEPRSQSPAQAKTYVDEFKKWCAKKANRGFETIEHIRDYVALHTLPAQESVRYYPLNFSDYNWLPAANRDPDEAAGTRPRAMKLARDPGRRP